MAVMSTLVKEEEEEENWLWTEGEEFFGGLGVPGSVTGVLLVSFS